MAQLGMIDLIGPIQAGFQMAQQAQAAALQRQQIQIQAQRMAAEMAEARALQEWRSRTAAIQESEEKRKAEMYAKELAQREEFQNVFKEKYRLSAETPADVAFFGAPQPSQADILRDAITQTVGATGQMPTGLSSIMGQEGAMERALLNAMTRKDIAEMTDKRTRDIADARQKLDKQRLDLQEDALDVKRHAADALAKYRDSKLTSDEKRAVVESLKAKIAAMKTLAQSYNDFLATYPADAGERETATGKLMQTTKNLEDLLEEFMRTSGGAAGAQGAVPITVGGFQGIPVD